MNDVTQILSQIESGDPTAAEQLLPLVYDELRKLAAVRLAHEQPGQTLQATALVHEAYLRLVDVQRVQQWDCRGHFFAAAAEAMRRILINRARDKKRLKRGGERKRINLDEIDLALDTPDDDLVAIDDAIQELEKEDLTGAKLVKLRFFAGLNLRQAAESLGLAAELRTDTGLMRGLGYAIVLNNLGYRGGRGTGSGYYRQESWRTSLPDGALACRTLPGH